MPHLGKDSYIYAFGKARKDINRTFEANGYPIENILCKFYKIPFLTNLRIISLYLILLHKIGLNNNIYIQYPVSCEKSFIYVIRLLHLYHCKVTLIIHDINSFRYKHKTKQELNILNHVDNIIVHTEAMKKMLNSNGVSTNMKIIYLFDYYSDDDFEDKQNIIARKKEVIFAGNLKKSEFIIDLCHKDFGDIEFNLYGNKGNIDFSSYKGKHYQGIFNSEHTASIKGGWGLVWDGDSTNTCSGCLGEYLRYNVSHKLSLYLAAGIPVIVWTKSAIAKYVTANKIGITIDNLDMITDRINNMSDKDYSIMIDKCRIQGQMLRNGEMLTRLLK